MKIEKLIINLLAQTVSQLFLNADEAIIFYWTFYKKFMEMNLKIASKEVNEPDYKYIFPLKFKYLLIPSRSKFHSALTLVNCDLLRK